MRIFRDSVNPARITPSHVDGVMPYVNGTYAWPEDEIQRFVLAGKQIVRIDIAGDAPHLASILDVERGDATPETAGAWIEQRNAYREDATVYISETNLLALFKATAGLSFWVLAADWTGSPHQLDNIALPRGVRMAGTQYASVPTLYDCSAIYDEGWHPAKHRDWIPV